MNTVNLGLMACLHAIYQPDHDFCLVLFHHEVSQPSGYHGEPLVVPIPGDNADLAILFCNHSIANSLECRTAHPGFEFFLGYLLCRKEQKVQVVASAYGWTGRDVELGTGNGWHMARSDEEAIKWAQTSLLDWGYDWCLWDSCHRELVTDQGRC